jgi:hypothetical protein
MKSTLIVLLSAGVFALAACDNAATSDANDKDTTASTTTTTSTESGYNTDVAANVPQPARTNFDSRYPQASNVRWSQYEPVQYDETDWQADWMTTMDTSDYQVNFNWDGMDYIVWYDNGEWLGSSARMTDNSKLPKAVNDAIHDRYSGYTIKEVDKENDKNKTVYEVDLEKGADKLKLHFDENGNVTKAKGKVDGEKVKAKDDTK